MAPSRSEQSTHEAELGWLRYLSEYWFMLFLCYRWSLLKLLVPVRKQTQVVLNPDWMWVDFPLAAESLWIKVDVVRGCLQ